MAFRIYQLLAAANRFSVTGWVNRKRSIIGLLVTLVTTMSLAAEFTWRQEPGRVALAQVDGSVLKVNPQSPPRRRWKVKSWKTPAP